MTTLRRPDTSVDRDGSRELLEIAGTEVTTYTGITMASTGMFASATSNPSGVGNSHTSDHPSHESDPELDAWICHTGRELAEVAGVPTYLVFDDEHIDFWIPLSKPDFALTRTILATFLSLRSEFARGREFEIDCHVLHGGDRSVPTGAFELDAA